MFGCEQTAHLTTFMNTLRSIIAIDRIPVNSITGFIRVGSSEVRVGNDIPWESISIRVPARLTVSDKIEDGVRLHTAQLVFHACDWEGGSGRWAYRCHMADGSSILIGTPERPYPVTTSTENHPDNMTDSQLDEVAVSWTSPDEIPYII